MNSTHYIIHRINLDIEAPDVAAAAKLQDDAVRIFRHWILPKLERLLNRLVPETTVFRLDSLDLDLGRMEGAVFDEEFADRLVRGFEEKIERIVAAAREKEKEDAAPPVTMSSPEEKSVAAFFVFLQTGRMPWWCEQAPDILREETVSKALVSSGSGAITQLFKLLGQNERALERLTLQFSPVFTLWLLEALTQIWFSSGGTVIPEYDNNAENKNNTALFDRVLQRIETVFQGSAPVVTELQWEFLLRVIRALTAETGGFDRELLDRLGHRVNAILGRLKWEARSGPEHAFSPEKPTSPSVDSTDSDDAVRGETSAPDEDGFFVPHAGLVLLHPFLEYYFRDFSLLDDEGFKDAASRVQAVYMLHYLASGTECPPEYLVGFEKYLCGIDLEVPIPRFIRLGYAMKEEGENLLRAAISHWKTLKRTSPAGLREGFLQRPGKLIAGDLQDQLIVESRSHDILLSFLPWGYGVIRLPWLQKPLFVDWVT